ncbi:MAG: hypothetical protein GQ570_10915 [Helicobacteraceae bacterium]|nr:hypothetical protein [Helicobacteraceae bacterium]
MKLLLSLLYVPAVFIILWYFDISLLKVLPLLLSLFFTILLLRSYLKRESMILYFARKFSKKSISKEEQLYIHSSTLFWIAVALVNVLVHFMIFIGTDQNLWLFYSSVGWYSIFIVAGLLQFLHRKFVFLKVSV